MEKFMFWKKKQNPADSAAQHLANLIRTSVAGFTPEPPGEKVDLNTELFIRRNVAIAELVIITGLIKGNQAQKELILKSIVPAHLGEKSFEGYLFTIIVDDVENMHEISLITVEQRIPEYSQVVHGEPANKKSLEGNFFKWSQILSFEPTNEQINKAIEVCQYAAKSKRPNAEA